MNQSENKPGRFLSRNVVVDKLNVGLKIVEIIEDGNVIIKPFENETASTSWTDKSIEIDTKTVPPSIKFK